MVGTVSTVGHVNRVKRVKPEALVIDIVSFTTDLTDITSGSPCLTANEELLIELMKTHKVAKINVGINEELQEFEPIIKNIRTLDQLNLSPGAKQRSPEWYRMRETMLTASDLAQAIGRGKYGTRAQLVQKKAFPHLNSFKSSPAMKWGTMCECLALKCYEMRNNNVKSFEFGLIPHPTLAHFGASPDSITALGIMVEIKCPSSRKLEIGKVPEHYYLQIQGQLDVCNLDLCDYVECSFEDIKTFGEYESKVEHDGERPHYHGAIVVTTNADGSEEYMYSPEQLTPADTTTWVEQTIDTLDNYLEVKFWRLRAMNIVRVKRDKALWATIEPEITQFWTDVMNERTQGPTISTSSSKKRGQGLGQGLNIDIDDEGMKARTYPAKYQALFTTFAFKNDES